MRCFIILVSLAYMAADAEASKAADKALYEAMQDRSAALMDRSAEAKDRQGEGQGCIDDACDAGFTCNIEAGLCEAEAVEQTECPAGWIELDNTCGGAASDKLCVTIGSPLKFVSWFHLQYECDAIGGYLPEPTDANKVNLELILSSLHSLYAKGDTPLLMYLGATDVTHENNWKWLKSAEDLAGADTKENWNNSTPPSQSDNKDCLAQQSSDKLWTNVNCEDDSMPNQIANICFAAPATAKALK